MSHLVFVVLQAVLYLNSCRGGHAVHRWVMVDTTAGAVDTEVTYCVADGG
jgi:hypothetical protein